MQSCRTYLNGHVLFRNGGNVGSPVAMYSPAVSPIPSEAIEWYYLRSMPVCTEWIMIANVTRKRTVCPSLASVTIVSLRSSKGVEWHHFRTPHRVLRVNRIARSITAQKRTARVCLCLAPLAISCLHSSRAVEWHHLLSVSRYVLWFSHQDHYLEKNCGILSHTVLSKCSSKWCRQVRTVYHSNSIPLSTL